MSTALIYARRSRRTSCLLARPRIDLILTRVEANCHSTVIHGGLKHQFHRVVSLASGSITVQISNIAGDRATITRTMTVDHVHLAR